VTFCNRQKMLFWNHADCHPAECELAGQTAPCGSCRHRGAVCALTNAPLPAQGGCCHWNIPLVAGRQEVTPRMLAILGLRPDETVEFVLQNLDVPYHCGPRGETMIDPEELGLPLTYGLGTEHLPEMDFDWSAWTGQWCREEQNYGVSN
jgi:hypothetical protein